jgi:hypothetical protein
MKKYFLIFLFISLIPGFTFAINQVLEGFRISSTPVTIDAHGVCQVVASTGSNDLFVPTKTVSEWQAFRDNRPLGETSMSACAFIGTCTWTQTGPQTCGYQHPALIAESDCASFSGFAGNGSNGNDDGATCIHGAWAGDGSPYGSCGGSQKYQRSYQCFSGPTPASSLGVNSSCCFGGTGCYGVCN